MEGNLVTPDNGLIVFVGWLSFTVTSTIDVVDVLDMFDYMMDDFTRMPKGARGYKTILGLSGYSLSVLRDGNSNMGIHVDVAGSAIGEFTRSSSETLKVNTPFGEGYDIDFGSTSMVAPLERIRDNGHVTRINVTIDGIGCNYFITDDVCGLYGNVQIISKFRNMRNVVESEVSGRKAGHIVYFGSRTSDVFLRAYDKQLERNRKLSVSGTHINNSWVCWELGLKNDRAVSVFKMFTSGVSLGAVAVGVPERYMRMVEPGNISHSRCTAYPVWADFMDGISSLKITAPKYEKTMDEKETRIKRQVMPTFAAVILSDGGSLEFVKDNLENGLNRMNKSLYKMAMDELGS